MKNSSAKIEIKELITKAIGYNGEKTIPAILPSIASIRIMSANFVSTLTITVESLLLNNKMIRFFSYESAKHS
jgi:hypothetical protein